MIRSSVTISMVPEAAGAPMVLWDDVPTACEKAARLGYNAVELFVPSGDVDADTIGKALSDHGLALSAVGTGAGWAVHKLSLSGPDATARERAADYVRSIIDLAGRFHAPAIVGSMQGRSSVEWPRASALSALGSVLGPLGEHAAGWGVPLLFEPLNRYETDLVNTLEAGGQFLASLETRNVKLLADLFHMNIEEPTITDALEQAGASLGHVHFVDSNRRPAGLGHLDYPPIVRALRSVGYDGYLSAEAFPYPDPDTAAKETIRAFRLYVRR